MCGNIFCKSFWMRNDGETAWPVGTQLLQTSGDNMSAKIVTIDSEVVPGATYELQVQFKAPEQEGRYTSFFRMQTGKIKFGHKVNCAILCVKPAEESLAIEEQESDLVKPVVCQTVEMASQEPVVAVEENAAAAGDKDMAEEPSALMQSMISIDAKSPKQIYFEDAEKLEESLKAALIALYEFGFTNFQANLVLMQKHKDVNVVAEQLMTGALNESQFGALN